MTDPTSGDGWSPPGGPPPPPGGTPPPQYPAPQYQAPQYPPNPAGPPPSVPWTPPPGTVPPPGAASPNAGAPTTNGFAVAALVLGIIGCFLVTGVLAVVFGIIGRKQIVASEGRQKGRGLATAGLVLGALWILLFAVTFTLDVTGNLDPDVPTRADFVAVVSTEMHRDNSDLDDLTPQESGAMERSIDLFGSCLYDVYLEEPEYLVAVYEDPSAADHFLPGVSQSDVDEIQENAEVCVSEHRDRVQSILSR